MPENKVILFIDEKQRKNVLNDLPLINMSLQGLFSRAGTCECLQEFPFLSKANFSEHFQMAAQSCLKEWSSLHKIYIHLHQLFQKL